MLSQEQIELLNQEVEKGEKARELLIEYNELVDRTKMLENWLEDISAFNINLINSGTIYTSRLLHIEDKKFAINKVKEIIGNELKTLERKIDKLI